MNEDDPRNISDLVSSQYVELRDVVQCISKVLSANKEKTLNMLIVFGLSELRPIAVQSGFDWVVVEDSSDKNLFDAIIHRLGGLHFSELTEKAQLYTSHYELYWGIPTLVSWCRHRQLQIPQDWDDWMNTTYHELHSRGLVGDMQDMAKHAATSNKQTSMRRKTQARHLRWKREYERLKKENKDKSDQWISIKISKMPIADSRKAETIRKNMKK